MVYSGKVYLSIKNIIQKKTNKKIPLIIALSLVMRTFCVILKAKLIKKKKYGTQPHVPSSYMFT